MSDPGQFNQFSQHRLRGESLPPDLNVILANKVALHDRCGMTLSADRDWAPWSDTSYLTPDDLANPSIAANIQAILDVVENISFVAATEDAEYLGYWRGLTGRSISESPIVRLDNEGQFNLCCGRSLADAILSQFAFEDDEFTDWKEWLESLGIIVPYASIDSMPVPEEKPTPKELHNRLFEEHLNK